MKEIKFSSYHDVQNYSVKLTIVLYGKNFYIYTNIFDKVYLISIKNNLIILEKNVSINTLKYDPVNNIILTNYGYLQSKPDGLCEFNSSNILDWETFAII